MGVFICKGKFCSDLLDGKYFFDRDADSYITLDNGMFRGGFQ
jgi:hypothetical protein